MCCQRTCVHVSMNNDLACRFILWLTARYRIGQKWHGTHTHIRARHCNSFTFSFVKFFFLQKKENSNWIHVEWVLACLCFRWENLHHTQCIHYTRLTGIIHLINCKMTSDVRLTRMNAFHIYANILLSTQTAARPRARPPVSVSVSYFSCCINASDMCFDIWRQLKYAVFDNEPCIYRHMSCYMLEKITFILTRIVESVL